MSNQNEMLAAVKQTDDAMQCIIEANLDLFNDFSKLASPAPNQVKAYLSFALARHYALEALSE